MGILSNICPTTEAIGQQCALDGSELLPITTILMAICSFVSHVALLFFIILSSPAFLLLTPPLSINDQVSQLRAKTW